MAKTGDPQPAIPLDKLLAAARQEDWDLIDQELPRTAQDSSFDQYAKELLNNNDPQARDLGASYFELCPRELDKDTTSQLTHMLEADRNPYARYRSAFALFTHGNRTPSVVNMLREATTDPDVREIAQGYLDQLEP